MNEVEKTLELVTQRLGQVCEFAEAGIKADLERTHTVIRAVPRRRERFVDIVGKKPRSPEDSREIEIALDAVESKLAATELTGWLRFRRKKKA